MFCVNSDILKWSVAMSDPCEISESNPWSKTYCLGSWYISFAHVIVFYYHPPGNSKKMLPSGILKTKSNLTLFVTEYFYSGFDLIKMKYVYLFSRTCPTEFTRDNSCKGLDYRVSCTFITNKSLAFSPKFFSKPWFWRQNPKDHWLLIKSPAQHFIFLT